MGKAGRGSNGKSALDGLALMIATAGEALIDLIADESGRLDPRPGGALFNAARTIARLGQPAAFLCRLSADRFGRMLRDSLEADGVIAVREPAQEPTTLAVVDVDAAGVAGYRFYLSGTSAAAMTGITLPDGTTALLIGALGLVMEPIGSAIERLVGSLPDDVLLMLDPNCRPSAIADRPSYLDRVARVLRRADVVKVSTEDLDYLGWPRDISAARCTLITDGAAPVTVMTASGHKSLVPVPPVDVVDTVGAGDAFGGAFLAWWTAKRLGRLDLAQDDKVRAATAAAVEVSALTCARRGAEPPWPAELTTRWAD